MWQHVLRKLSAFHEAISLICRVRNRTDIRSVIHFGTIARTTTALYNVLWIHEKHTRSAAARELVQTCLDLFGCDAFVRLWAVWRHSQNIPDRDCILPLPRHVPATSPDGIHLAVGSCHMFCLISVLDFGNWLVVMLCLTSSTPKYPLWPYYESPLFVYGILSHVQSSLNFKCSSSIANFAIGNFEPQHISRLIWLHLFAFLYCIYESIKFPSRQIDFRNLLHVLSE